MRVLALDIGDVRVGIAVSDPDGRIASPVCVLPAQEVFSHARSFRSVLGSLSFWCAESPLHFREKKDLRRKRS